jgi:hypothetical protein
MPAALEALAQPNEPHDARQALIDHQSLSRWFASCPAECSGNSGRSPERCGPCGCDGGR